MEQSPEQRRIAGRMAPGALSRDGFLGTDARSIDEIVEADLAELTRLGLTYEQVEQGLCGVLDAAVAALGMPVELGGGWTAVHREAMGRIACPFGRCGLFHKGEVDATNVATGEAVRFTPLSIHLIARHGFFQGRGATYRIEPAAVARLLRVG